MKQPTMSQTEAETLAYNYLLHSSLPFVSTPNIGAALTGFHESYRNIYQALQRLEKQGLVKSACYGGMKNTRLWWAVIRVRSFPKGDIKS